MSEENNTEKQDSINLSWGARKFITEPSSKVLFFSVSLVLVGIFAFVGSSFFISIDLTVKTQGLTDSLQGIKEVVSPLSGELGVLTVKDGDLIEPGQIIGRLKISGSTEEDFVKYLASLTTALEICKSKNCDGVPRSFEFPGIEDARLREFIAGVNKKFADFRYRKNETSETILREIRPLEERLRTINRKIAFLEASRMREYLLMQKEGLEDEKARLEQQIRGNENSLSVQIRESKVDAVHALELAIFAFEDFVTKHEIRSPVSGKVAKISKYPGSFLSQFEPILLVIPEESPIVAKVAVSSKDVARIRKDMKVLVGIDAYPHHKYGYFEGKVLVLDEVQADEKIPGAYFARVSIDPVPKQRMPASALKTIRLVPGMSVEARILTGRSKLIQVFIDKVLGEFK